MLSGVDMQWEAEIIEAVGGNVGSPRAHSFNSAEFVRKPLRATLLAEPFPGELAQGDNLPKAGEMKALSFG